MKKNTELVDIEVKKKKWNIYSIFGLLGDILFYPVIIISLLSCFAILASKQSNKVPSIFGLSMVSISSGSMKASGFEVKDIVFTTSVNTDFVQAGDIITFYYYQDPADKNKRPSNLTVIQTYDRGDPSQPNHDFNKGIKSEYNTETLNTLRECATTETERKAVRDLSDTVKVYFHRVIGIYADDEGHLFFRTQGDSNASADSYLVAAEYVHGKYLNTPTFIRGIFSFMATTTGIIVLVVLPLSILSLFLLFSIIEQISKMMLEKKLLRRELRYDDEDVVKGNIGIEMDPLDKISYYAESPADTRFEVFEFLWGYLSNGTEKERALYNDIRRHTNNFDINPNNYWAFWISQQKSNKKKLKVEQMKSNWEKANKLNTNLKAKKV